MKKITLLAALAFSAFVSAQSVSINTINGMTPAAYLASLTDGNLIEGSTLEVNLNYTDLAGASATAGVRLLNNWAVIAGTQVGNVVGTGSGSTTVTLTVPDVTENVSVSRIQGIVQDDSGSKFDPLSGYSINDLTTLSINQANKVILEDAYYDGNGAIVVGEELVGDYAVYNVLGAVIAKGNVTSSIDVSSLASGVYILATEAGYLKFVK